MKIWYKYMRLKMSIGIQAVFRRTCFCLHVGLLKVTLVNREERLKKLWFNIAKYFVNLNIMTLKMQRLSRRVNILLINDLSIWDWFNFNLILNCYWNSFPFCIFWPHSLTIYWIQIYMWNIKVCTSVKRRQIKHTFI